MTPPTTVMSFPTLPDFDQFWSALPYGGDAYCFPAAALDWLVCINSSLAPGVFDWPTPQMLLPAPYDPGTPASLSGSDIASGLEEIGCLSNTRDCGTEPQDAYLGLQKWMLAHSGWVLPYQAVGMLYSDGCRISIDDLAEWCAAGAMPILLVGWYELKGDSYVRDGGHYLALEQYDYASPEAAMATVCDATPDDEVDVQQEFTTSPYVLQPQKVKIGTKHVTLPSLGYHSNADGSLLALVDNVIFIRPTMVAYCHEELLVTTFYRPGDPGPYERRRALSSRTSRTPGPGAVTALRLDPLAPAAWYLKRGSPELWRFHVASGRSERIAELPAVAVRLAAGGRDPQVFVVTADRRLWALDRHGRRRSDPLQLPFDCAALEYDEAGQRLVAADAHGHALVVPSPVDGGFGRPLSLDLGGPTGALAVDPSDGRLWRAAPGGSHIDLYQVQARTEAEAGRVTLARSGPGIDLGQDGAVDSIHFDGAGGAFVCVRTSEGERIVEIDAKGGRRAHPLFAGVSASPVAAFSRWFSNIDPARTHGHAWRNVARAR